MTDKGLSRGNRIDRSSEIYHALKIILRKMVRRKARQCYRKDCRAEKMEKWLLRDTGEGAVKNTGLRKKGFWKTKYKRCI
jgi:hypothetical protein